MISGPSSSGKTTLLNKIIRVSDKLIKGQTGKKVILFYLSEQKLYDQWEEDGLLTFKHKGIPTSTEFLEIIDLYCGKQGGICIFDDLDSEIKKNISFFRELMLVHSHHKNLSVFLILHNLFTQGTRDLSLNCHRFIITHNPRDALSVSTLARQCFPNSRGFLPSVYKKIGEKKFGYLLLDFGQNTPQDLRGEYVHEINTKSFLLFSDNKLV